MPTIVTAVRVERGGRLDMPAVLDEFERRLLIAALTEAGGIKARAAQMLMIHRTTLVEKMRKHDIRWGENVSCGV